MQGIDKILIYPISFNKTLNIYNPVYETFVCIFFSTMYLCFCICVLGGIFTGFRLVLVLLNFTKFCSSLILVQFVEYKIEGNFYFGLNNVFCFVFCPHKNHKSMINRAK